MKLLALETTDFQLGACLWEDTRVKLLKTDNDTERLMPLTHALFQKARWSPHDLDALVVDIGPGRFTGIRMGISAVRTLGLALQKPVVEVNSLEAVAAQGSGWEMGKSFVWKFPHDLLCVLLKTLRDEVYMAVWRFHKLSDRARRGLSSGRSLHTFGHHFKLVHAPTLFPFGRFLSFFKSCFQEQTLLFVGTGAQEYRKDLQKAFGSRARFGPVIKNVNAGWVAALGAEKYFRREFKSYTQIQSLYLRPSYIETAKTKAV